MKAALNLILFLFAAPALALAQAPRARDGLDLPLLASVISAALAFITPRALDEVTARQIALWGLGAPAAMDSTLSTQVQNGAVLLMQDGRVIFTRPLPASDAPGDWGSLAADVLNAAFTNSVAVRMGGLQGLITSFFDEVFNHLDPYSRYVAPDAANADRAKRSGEAGLGIQIARRGQAVIVTGVNADGPGADSGIRIGDRITAVDGQTLTNEDIEDVRDMIGGLEGTTVSITVRSRGGPPRTMDVERVVIPPETVFAARENELLVIRVASFASDTDDRLRHELTARLSGAAGRGIRGVVLDLRGNRGGLLRQAIASTDLLVKSGVVAQTAGRNPQAARIWRANGTDLATNRPLIILMDGRSASAAEIMAAALSDQGRAVVVGSSSLGKGLVQTIATLPDGGELFISWSRVLAPWGWPVQGLGVLPQVCTGTGLDALNEQLAALDQGEQKLAEALARHRAARAPLPPAEVVALRSPCPAAEARDSDMTAARYLITHPRAYETALVRPPS